MRLTPVQTIAFDGFLADEVYPIDINGDGRLEILALQSPGVFASAVYARSPYPWQILPEEQKRVHCLTALDQTGRVL